MEALVRLHRAQVELVPYETTWLHMGEPWTVDAIRRPCSGSPTVAGAATASTSTVPSRSCSRALGYHVTLMSAASTTPGRRRRRLGNHLVLMVDDLPMVDNLDGWFVNAGLGDGLYEPPPRHPGDYRQVPFTFRFAAEADGAGTSTTTSSGRSPASPSWRSPSA